MSVSTRNACQWGDNISLTYSHPFYQVVFAAVLSDPTRPETSKTPVRRLEKYDEQTRSVSPESVSGWLATSPRSRVLDFPDRWPSSNMRSRRRSTDGEHGTEYSRSLCGGLKDAESAVYGGRVGNPLLSASQPGGRPASLRNQRTVTGTPPVKGSSHIPENFRRQRSSSVTGSRGSLPSFKDIVRRMQEDAERRRMSEFSIFTPLRQGTTRGMKSHFEQVLSLRSGSGCGRKDEMNRQSNSGNGAFRAPGGRGSSIDALYRDFARERLKRSFTRLSSAMSSSASRGHMDEAGNDVSISQLSLRSSLWNDGVHAIQLILKMFLQQSLSVARGSSFCVLVHKRRISSRLLLPALAKGQLLH